MCYLPALLGLVELLGSHAGDGLLLGFCPGK